MVLNSNFLNFLCRDDDEDDEESEAEESPVKVKRLLYPWLIFCLAVKCVFYLLTGFFAGQTNPKQAEGPDSKRKEFCALHSCGQAGDDRVLPPAIDALRGALKLLTFYSPFFSHPGQDA